MTENLKKWIEENKMMVSEGNIDNLSTIIIEGVGTFLFLSPDENGKLIDEDFSFMMTDEEYEVCDDKKVDFLLFEFGTKFYYSHLISSTNKYNEPIYKPEFLDFKYLGKCSEPFVMDFTHLGCHTEYEMLSGSGGCDLWCKKAKFLGHKAIGVCDKDSLASSLAFQTCAEKVGLKSIIGETITVARNYDEDEDLQETFELKLFVLNAEGWHNLLLISKTLHVDHDGYIPDTELYQYGRGLCCVIPKNSDFNDQVRHEGRKEADKLLKKYKKAFDKVYYQIDTVEYVSERLFKEHLQDIDNYVMYYRDKVEPLLINDAYYLDAEEKDLKPLLHKISGKAASEANDQYFKSVGDTIAAYSDWLDDVELLVEVITTGIENTSLLTAAITFRINNSERKIPKFEVEDPEGLFFEKLQKGIEERLVGKVDDIDKYMKRIETECNLIVPNDLCSYFLILADIGDWCRSRNIMIGPGRGSVAGSLVAYCLHIHDVDPIPLGLYFERFLNESRVSAHHSYNITFEDGSKIKLNTGDKVVLANGEECEVGKGFDPSKLNFKQGKVSGCKSSTFYTDLPDVDQDYPTYARDLVKDYIKDKYGHDYSCSVGTYTRAKLKTCIKDFAKAKGLPFDLTNKITKDIDDQIEYTWTDLFEYASKSKSLFKFVQQYPEIVHMTKYALLLCKAESIHPSAVIIVPKISQETGKSMNIYEWLPTKQIDGMLVSEWEGKYTESALFLKEDILGLNQLDKFQNMLRLIKQDTGKEIDVNKIPFNDEEVFKYFRKGWCEDVFQFGTNSLMNYCKQVKPTEFSDLAAMTALFRPGPIASNAHLEFAKIKNGKSKPKYDYGVKNITEETYSLLVYQEQMMSIIHQLGGLSLIEAEDARKYIKKKKHKELAALGDRFIAGAMKNGCPEDEAHKIWDKMNAFSSYSFNKCISGEEIIAKVGYKTTAFVPTIAEMYKIRNSRSYAKNTGHEQLCDKYNRCGYGMCWSYTSDGRVKRNHIVDIQEAGWRRTYEVVTESGRRIVVTMNHKFPTLSGDKMLAQLKVGDMIPVMVGYQEETPEAKWDYGVGGSFNYPEKGQCGFRKKEFSVSKFFDDFCSKNIEENRPCDVCGCHHRRMEAHHKDGNHANNDISNLAWLCPSCHKKAHYKLGRVKMGEKGLLCKWDKIVSIKFKREEMTYDVEVSGDVSHTFLTAGGVITCNSHAAAYTYMSYWSQWFKVNYPLEFWTTSLQYAKEDEIPFRLAELKKTGVTIEIRQPDVNYSGDNFTCDPENNRIFYSLCKIKGVGDIAVKHLVETRNAGGEFFSLEEFCSRVPSKVNKTVVKALIIAGAFDLLEGIEQPRDRRKLLQKYLIDIKGDNDIPDQYNTEEAKISNSFWTILQKESTGFGEIDYMSMLPNKRMKRLFVSAADFSMLRENSEAAIAGNLVAFTERDIKTGKMCNIQVSSSNEIIYCTLWPDAYEPILESVGGDMLDVKGKVICISGMVKKDKFRNHMTLYSDRSTKMYIIS